MRTPAWITIGALLPIALGCRDDAGTPTAPSPTGPQAGLVAATTLVFSLVSAGETHTCGIATDGRAYCWGENDFGQLGDGTEAPHLSPRAVIGGHIFGQISAGNDHTCGVTTSKVAYCWGSNEVNQLGDGTNEFKRVSPVPVVGGLQFRSVSAGSGHTCGVTTASRAYCWGYNTTGQLGDGTRTRRLAPVPVAGGLYFRQVSPGGTSGPDEAGYFTCGISTARRAYCWGSNRYGQLGDSTEVAFRTRPVRVSGGRYYRDLDAGYYHACAVTTDYRAFCWGNGRNGQLGNGKTYLSFWPRRVAGGLSFERVTAGWLHSCGETTANRAYCWGTNYFGWLGDGTTTDRLTPVAVAGGLSFKQLSAGMTHTCGKTASAVAYCWGGNAYGQLGDGTEEDRPVPTPVAGSI